MNEDGTWTVVWQNEHVNNSLNPRWAQTVYFPFYLFLFSYLDHCTRVFELFCGT